ncbi:efflux RND transporter periplasmic adaptor subunit [Hyphomicrobium sp. NDB2Meth4]|uniref:efflux RND transporter periplasmic adaptor subunit n=1 Tax=Hyphomicrobium sp. NDB2Meth4 TaxID=1892846 RepID=UPI000A5CAC9E|nr:efflux RND transporter periplasmic adaptor subunit [Hyphomicrobium sp. NDB2Meth4]
MIAQTKMFAGWALLLTLPLLALGGCGEAKDEPAPPPRPVLTVVVSGPHAEVLSFAGTVEPRYRAELSFRVLGRVVARDVEVGDVVHKGQRVAALDPTALQLAVRSQRAALANAQATLTNAAAVEERQRALRDRNVTAQATFETAEQARIAAEAEVTRTQSGLTKAQEQLTYTELRSDFDGVVTAISAEVGQVVSVGQTAVTVARPDVREAVVDIPETASRNIGPGTRFEISLQLDESRSTSGVLREIAPEADAITRSRRARITLADPPETFRLGTTVTVKIRPAAGASHTVRLPASALIEREGGSSVFIVNEESGAVAEVPVEVVGHSGGSVIVAGALAAGTHVVTAGVKSLSVGEHVRTDVGAIR